MRTVKSLLRPQSDIRQRSYRLAFWTLTRKMLWNRRGSFTSSDIAVWENWNSWPYTDASYQPVYEQANEYEWVLLFHTGIVLRRNFDKPEDVASYRMRAFYLEEVARRYPRLTVIGAHCGNPEYQWAAEVARWNPNIFFDLSGSTLHKMSDRLSEFQKIFWWSGTDEGTKTPDNDSSAFSKLVFGSDTSLDAIEHVIGQYRSLFQACGVLEHTQKRVMGGTLSKIFNLTH